MVTIDTISDRVCMKVCTERGHVELLFDTGFIKFELTIMVL